MLTSLWNSHNEMKTFFLILLGEEQGQGRSVIPTRGEGGGITTTDMPMDALRPLVEELLFILRDTKDDRLSHICEFGCCSKKRSIDHHVPPCLLHDRDLCVE